MGKLRHQADWKASLSQMFLCLAEGLTVSLGLSPGMCYFVYSFACNAFFKVAVCRKGGKREHGEFVLSSRLFKTKASGRGDGSAIRERKLSFVPQDSCEKAERGSTHLQPQHWEAG